MRIALTSPFGYPEVARGAERYCSELSAWLTGRGHEVTWMYTARDPTRRDGLPEGAPIEIVPRRPERGAGRLQRDALVQAGRALHGALRGRSFDVAQCHHHVDAAAVRMAARRAPYVIWVPGVARRSIVRQRLLHVLSTRIAMGGAARVHTLSSYAQAALLSELGVQSEVIAPGIDVTRYAGERPAPAHPRLVCMASADDPRKHVQLLVQAFSQLLRHHPDAELIVANHRPDAAERLRDSLDEPARQQMTVRSGLDFEALAALYRSATVSVLPSVDEAFGLVMVESLAAGTPVVGTNHGAIPEIIDDDAIGRRFAPGDRAGLVAALLAAIELSADPATVDRCRQRAQRWSWSTVGPRLEAIYADVAG